MLETILTLAVGFFMGRKSSEPQTVIIRDETPTRIAYREEPKEISYKDYDVEVGAHENRPDLITDQKKEDSSFDWDLYIKNRIDRYHYSEGYTTGNVYYHNEPIQNKYSFLRGFEDGIKDSDLDNDWKAIRDREWGWIDAMENLENPTFPEDKYYMEGWLEGLKDRPKSKNIFNRHMAKSCEPDLITDQKKEDPSFDWDLYIKNRIDRYNYSNGCKHGETYCNKPIQNKYSFLRGFEDGIKDSDFDKYYHWDAINNREWGWMEAMENFGNPTLPEDKDYMEGWLEGLKDRPKLKNIINLYMASCKS